MTATRWIIVGLILSAVLALLNDGNPVLPARWVHW